MVEAARTSQLQTVTQLRDACRIGHRLARTYSELRQRGRGTAAASVVAYPLMWMVYVTITCIEASSTVHSGAASLIAPNPVARPPRRLWRGVLLIAVLVIGISQLLAQAPPTLRHVLYIAGGLCVAASFVEVAASWKIGPRAGPLKLTERRVRASVAGSVVRGGTFGAWPQHSGQFGPLLDDVLDELRRDGITLLVQARDEGLVETYIRHGAVQPNPEQPRHIMWPAD